MRISKSGRNRNKPLSKGRYDETFADEDEVYELQWFWRECIKAQCSNLSEPVLRAKKIEFELHCMILSGRFSTL